MVKILAIGDFHGAFPKKFNKIVKNEKIDFVISTGDYPPFFYRKLWFKHCYNTDTQLWEIVGKKKHREILKEDLRRAERALKKLNALPIPVYTVLGNIDFPNPNDIMDVKKSPEAKELNWDEKKEFIKILSKYKNIKRFDYSFVKHQDYIVIGMRGHSFQGVVKSKAFKKHKLKLEKIFKKFSKENKEGKVIFVSHNMPYGILDKVGKHAHKKVRGKHVGSKLAQRVLKKFQPILALGGHIHESKGKQKLGKTLCINPGSAHEGRAAIIEIKDGKIKKTKLI